MTKDKDRIQFFATYYEQGGRYRKRAKSGEVWGEWEPASWTVVAGLAYHPFTEVQLLLKSLSDITEEDAEVLRQSIDDYEGDWEDLQWFEETFIINARGIIAAAVGTILLIGAIDILRSLGYHTGYYMHYDPIKEGWAQLIEKK